MSAALLPLLMLACKDGGSDTSDPSVDDTDTPSADGCFVVDDTAGFDDLQSALDWSSEGSTITLCAGEITGSLVVNTPLSLVGAGADEVRWTGDTNQAVLKVSGVEGVTISGLTLSSDRLGVQIENAADVTLSDLTFEDGMASSAIRSTDSENVSIDTVTIRGAGGGIEIVSGSATISSSTITDTLGFGILADSGAVVTASENTIAGIDYTELVDDSLADGFDIMAREGASLTTFENSLTPTYVGVWGPEADVALEGDTIVGGFYGVFAYLGAFSTNSVTIDGPQYVGIFVQTQDPVSVVDTVVTMPGEDGEESSFGVEIDADEVTLDGLTVSGSNYLGLYLGPFNDEVSISATDVTVTDAGCIGIIGAYLDGSFENLVLDGHRNYQGASCLAALGYDTDSDGIDDTAFQFGMEFDYSDITWTGGGVTSTDGYGLVAYQSTVAISEASFDNAVPFLEGLSGVQIFNQYSDLSIENTSFSNNRYSLYNYSGDLDVSGSTFTENHVSYVATDGSYALADYSQDLYSSTTGTVNVTDNAFSDGSYGLNLYGGTGTVRGNTWTGYNQRLISVASSGAYGVVDNTISDSGAYLVYCSGGTLQGSGLTIDGSGTYTYASTYYDAKGKEKYTSEGTSYGYSVYASSCDLELDALTVTNPTYSPVFVASGTTELSNVSITPAETTATWGSAAIYAYGSGTDEFHISDAVIESPDLSYYGLYLSSYSDVTMDRVTAAGGTHAVYLSALSAPSVTDLEATGGTSTGLYVSSVSNGSFSDVSASDNTGRGVYAVSSTVDFVGATMDRNGTEGFYSYLGTLDIDGGTASDNGDHGVSTSATNLALTGVEVAGNGGYGLNLNTGAAVAIDGVTVSGSGSDGVYVQTSSLDSVDSSSNDNAGYGMTCSDATLTGTLTTSGNGSGDTNGCDASAGGDTGI